MKKSTEYWILGMIDLLIAGQLNEQEGRLFLIATILCLVCGFAYVASSIWLSIKGESQ